MSVLLGGCSFFLPNPRCPPPPSARRPVTQTYSCTSATVLPIIPNPDKPLSVSELVDLGLQNSPQTRGAWYQAKQAAADVGTARGAYLPSVSLIGFWIRDQIPEVNLGFEALNREKHIGVALSTSYLLFDFGGRNANLMSATAALENLNWMYNWEVQTVMINVIQSYYNYINALAIVEADKATVQDNVTTLEAASALSTQGVNSISDELQAKTSLIGSQITLEQDVGNLNVARATLVQSVGLSADSSICVSDVPQEIATDAICKDMKALVRAAKEKRADLKGQRASVLESRFNIRAAQSKLLPTLNSEFFGAEVSLNDNKYLEAFVLRFSVTVPLFSSFSNINNLRKTQAALLQSQATLDQEELSAFLTVVSDYYELIANTQILKYSYEHLRVAKKNREVAFANYKAGVTTIIDLMTANSALNTARKEVATSKTNFLTSLGNLAYNTGELSVNDIVNSQTEASCESN